MTVGRKATQGVGGLSGAEPGGGHGPMEKLVVMVPIVSASGVPDSEHRAAEVFVTVI